MVRTTETIRTMARGERARAVAAKRAEKLAARREERVQRPQPVLAVAADDGLRAWLASAAERFDWFKHVAHSREVAKACRMYETRSGRNYGRIALQRAFEPVAVLQASGTGRLPFLCWACLRPQSDTVAINLALVQRFADGRVNIIAMTWSANVSHDALSEALHGGQDLDAALMELHTSLLDAPASAAEMSGPVAVPAGGGYFVGAFMEARAGNEPCMIFQAQRWVPAPPDDAEPIGGAGEGEARLADHWLDPLRLASAQWPTPEDET